MYVCVSEIWACMCVYTYPGYGIHVCMSLSFKFPREAMVDTVLCVMLGYVSTSLRLWITFAIFELFIHSNGCNLPCTLYVCTCMRACVCACVCVCVCVYTIILLFALYLKSSLHPSTRFVFHYIMSVLLHVRTSFNYQTFSGLL